MNLAYPHTTHWIVLGADRLRNRKTDGVMGDGLNRVMG